MNDVHSILGNVLGGVGTALLVLAFILNVTGNLKISFAYTYINLIGAGLAAAASLLIGFIPFLILESVWFVAAAAKLFSLHAGAKSDVESFQTRQSG